MPELTIRLLVFLICVGAFTLIAAVWDSRYRRIPNKFTLPMFLLGLVFQVVANGWSGTPAEAVAGAGLKSALLAFLVGFGTLFLLWMIGGGGGGDVKLMGALSVWLGFRLTLHVLAVATAVVFVSTFGVIMWSMLTSGAKKTKSKYVGTGKSGSAKPEPETVQTKQGRRIMAFALPVAVATWAMIIWNLKP